jgi:hypothetical protein
MFSSAWRISQACPGLLDSVMAAGSLAGSACGCSTPDMCRVARQACLCLDSSGKVGGGLMLRWQYATYERTVFRSACRRLKRGRCVLSCTVHV